MNNIEKRSISSDRPNYRTGGDIMDQQNVEKLFAGLSKEQQQQVRNILADRKETERILSSPQAQELLKKLKKGKTGG